MYIEQNAWEMTDKKQKDNAEQDGCQVHLGGTLLVLFLDSFVCHLQKQKIITILTQDLMIKNNKVSSCYYKVTLFFCTPAKTIDLSGVRFFAITLKRGSSRALSSFQFLDETFFLSPLSLNDIIANSNTHFGLCRKF